MSTSNDCVLNGDYMTHSSSVQGNYSRLRVRLWDVVSLAGVDRP